MAGHSKWANIQHRKGAQDAKRSKIFTKLIREITVAARLFGGDLDSNPRLKLATNAIEQLYNTGKEMEKDQKLMSDIIKQLVESKNIANSFTSKLSKEENEALQIAILLHDVGHGPFSHTLEYSLVTEIHHEDISLKLMENLNVEFNGKLTLAIEMFKGEYKRPFFNQLIY